MFRNLVTLLIVAALFCFSLPARAATFFFGTQDKIHFVAKTTIQGPGQSDLFIGHRVTTKAFLLPYYVKSNGYVLGISGDTKKYMPMPSDAELAALQTKGLLPNPLPPLKMGWFDYIFGYSLWLALFIILGVPFLKKKLFGKQED